MAGPAWCLLVVLFGLVIAAGQEVPLGGEATKRTPALAIVEADHNAYDEATKAEIRRALKGIKLNQEEEEEEDKDDTDDMQESPAITEDRGRQSVLEIDRRD